MSYVLWPHQVKAESLLREGSAALHWEMRLGKTRPILHAFNQMVMRGEVHRLIFVTVMMAKSTIEQEAQEMGLDMPVIMLKGKKRKELRGVELRDIPAIYILNWEILPQWQDWLQARYPYVLALDESHLYLRNPENQRYQAAQYLAQFALRTWLLSGTMMVNGAMDLYWQMKLLGRAFAMHNLEPDAFGKKYSHARWNKYLKGGQGDFEWVGLRNEADLISKLRRSYSSLRIPQVAPDTPLPQHIPRWITDLEKPWDFDRNNDVLSEEIRELIPKKSQLTAEYVRDMSERPTVVFGWNREFTETVSQLLEAPLIYGGTDALERARLQREFQQGKIPVLVGNYRSLGLGVSLSRANHFVFGEPYWDATLYLQAAARGVDLQKKEQTVHHHLLASGSVDEYVWKARLQKGKAIERLHNASVVKLALEQGHFEDK